MATIDSAHSPTPSSLLFSLSSQSIPPPPPPSYPADGATSEPKSLTFNSIRSPPPLSTASWGSSLLRNSQLSGLKPN
uniref:Uncharacterized protein n=1 Tax=Chenopodium quinoa TaxID=63459 RepID=A0A803MF07_CHEQI